MPSAYVARRAGTKNRVVVLARQAGNRLPGSSNGLQIRALGSTEVQQKKQRGFSGSVIQCTDPRIQIRLKISRIRITGICTFFCNPS